MPGMIELTEQEKFNATMETTKQTLFSAVQVFLDETAAQRGYDSLLSACSYAGSSHPKFRDEGTACLVWRDAVWVYCQGVLDAATKGLRPIPTEQSLIAELPAIVW